MGTDRRENVACENDWKLWGKKKYKTNENCAEQRVFEESTLDYIFFIFKVQI